MKTKEKIKNLLGVVIVCFATLLMFAFVGCADNQNLASEKSNLENAMQADGDAEDESPYNGEDDAEEGEAGNDDESNFGSEEADNTDAGDDGTKHGDNTDSDGDKTENGDDDKNSEETDEGDENANGGEDDTSDETEQTVFVTVSSNINSAELTYSVEIGTSVEEFINTFVTEIEGYEIEKIYVGGSELGEDIEISEDVAIYISYKICQYTVSFYCDGELIYSTSVGYGGGVEYFEEPTKEGEEGYSYTFAGWADASGNLIDLDELTIEADTDLYAVFDAKYKYSYLNFAKIDGGYEVTGFSGEVQVFVEIPATYNGENVISIAEKAFKDCIEIVSVVIGENIESIGDDAFANCYKIVEVCNLSKLPIGTGSNNNFGSVAANAFRVYSADEESNIVIVNQDFVYYVEEDIYFLVAYLGDAEEITLPEIESYIYCYAFANCTFLKVINIPSVVVLDFGNEFAGCSDTLQIIYLQS